jgi:hypothetical protein
MKYSAHEKIHPLIQKGKHAIESSVIEKIGIKTNLRIKP